MALATTSAVRNPRPSELIAARQTREVGRLSTAEKVGEMLVELAAGEWGQGRRYVDTVKELTLVLKAVVDQLEHATATRTKESEEDAVEIVEQATALNQGHLLHGDLHAAFARSKAAYQRARAGFQQSTQRHDAAMAAGR